MKLLSKIALVAAIAVPVLSACTKQSGGEETVAVTGVTLDKATLSMKVGQDGTETLTATVAPTNATNKNVTWTVDNESVASITPNGASCTVTAGVAGTAVVTVTTADGNKTASCTVEVTSGTIEPTFVTVDPEEATVDVGATVTIAATVYPADATDKSVTWSSADENIATVDENGIVTGVANGKVDITVTTVVGGKTATCSVKVGGLTKLTLEEGWFSTNAMMEYVSQDSGCDQYGLNGDHNWFNPITQDQIDARTADFGNLSNMWDEDDGTCFHTNMDWGQTYSSWGYRDGATPGAKTLAYLTVTFPDNYTTVQLKVTANTNTAGKCFSKSWSRTVEEIPYSYSVDGFLLYWSSDGEEFVLYEDEEITAGKVSCPGYGGTADVTLKATAEMPSIAAIKITSQMNPADEDPDGANDWTGTDNSFGIAEMEIFAE